MFRPDATQPVAAGIDVGSTALWVATLRRGQAGPTVLRAEALDPSDASSIGAMLMDVSVVAIDAPASTSTLPHLEDRRLAAKFQRARCGEVALRLAGIPVPFVSPAADDPLPDWMARGIAAFELAREAGTTAIECFPHGVFWRLAGQPVLHKQRAAGRAVRRALLAEVLVPPVGFGFWPHDALDALACAYVALLAQEGVADRITCSLEDPWPTHDGSEIWLPRAKLQRTAPED